jgi:hypothetical protein
MKLLEPEWANIDENYKSAAETDFQAFIDNQLFYKYNELLSVIQYEIYKKTLKSISSNRHFFNSTLLLPPVSFNGQTSLSYLHDRSTNTITNNSYSKLIQSHPLLPIYLTTNNKGIISTWSYQPDSKKSIDEFYIEKITKESLSKNKNLKRINFNSYGNEFFTIDDTGNVYFYDFDNQKGNKLPKLTLWTTNSKASRDGVYLNNSGIFSTTSNRNNAPHHTTLWDFLLPLNQSNVGEIDCGGNLIHEISGDSSMLVCNDKPGMISFIDIRRMSVVNSFQAHLDEIKCAKVSEKENFLITCGKGKLYRKKIIYFFNILFLDGFVKIWDLALKTNPLLIESFQPFPSKEHKTQHIRIELANGLLFASTEGHIKLLRNKLF